MEINTISDDFPLIALGQVPDTMYNETDEQPTKEILASNYKLHNGIYNSEVLFKNG